MQRSRRLQENNREATGEEMLNVKCSPERNHRMFPLAFSPSWGNYLLPVVHKRQEQEPCKGGLKWLDAARKIWDGLWRSFDAPYWTQMIQKTPSRDWRYKTEIASISANFPLSGWPLSLWRPFVR